MNEQEKERLEIYCRQALKENFDLFDFKSNIDSTLTYGENLGILCHKIDTFYAKEVTKQDIQEYEIEESKYQTEQKTQISKVLQLFLKPKIIGICADPNEGKSNTIYYLIKELQKAYTFNLCSYGLKINLSEQKLYSLEELESVKNSIIFIDEYYNLFDLEDRKKRRQIEQTLRLLYHNNNVIVLSGLPDNFKKFISSKLDMVMFKKSTLSTFINGSSIKNIAMNYKGQELGSSILGIDLEQVLIYDGKHYNKLDIPYMKVFDTKRKNCDILSTKKSAENVVKK